MNRLLFHREEYEQLYACRDLDIESVPLAERQHPLIGCAFIVVFIFYEVLYIPCLIAIYKHIHRSCYKFMFYIGVVDILCLWIAGFLTGLFAIQGDVFCSSPMFIYLTGIAAFALWVAESSAAILLAISRCIEVCSDKFGRTLMVGKRTWFWLIPPTLYAAYNVFFTNPILFSSVYVSYFFDPYIGYNVTTGYQYKEKVQAVHNLTVLFTLCFVYGAFCVFVGVKSRHPKGIDERRRVAINRTTFLQAALISAVNAIAAGIYVYMQYFPTSFAVIVVGQFCWFSVHGMPPLIYLIMNRTIRQEVQVMITKLVASKRIAMLPTLWTSDTTVVARTSP